MARLPPTAVLGQARLACLTVLYEFTRPRHVHLARDPPLALDRLVDADVQLNGDLGNREPDRHHPCHLLLARAQCRMGEDGTAKTDHLGQFRAEPGRDERSSLCYIPHGNTQLRRRAFVRDIPQRTEPASLMGERPLPFITMNENAERGIRTAELAEGGDADVPQQPQPDQHDIAPPIPDDRQQAFAIFHLVGNGNIRVSFEDRPYADPQ